MPQESQFHILKREDEDEEAINQKRGEGEGEISAQKESDYWWDVDPVFDGLTLNWHCSDVIAGLFASKLNISEVTEGQMRVFF